MVIGGGAVGQLAALSAQVAGARIVVLVEPNETRRAFAIAQGSITVHPDQAEALVRKLTEGDGAEVVVEAEGGNGPLDFAMSLARARTGRVRWGARGGELGLPRRPRVQGRDDTQLRDRRQHPAAPQAAAAGHQFVPVAPGALALLIEGDPLGIETSESLSVLCKFFALALQTCERQRIAVQNLDEVQALQRVATRMLKSHDLSEILLLITQEAKQLLSADICGVLQREDDKIVMRRCVGNRSPETANLQMGPGQGLAGLVLERRKPASVEDAVASESISRDFSVWPRRSWCVLRWPPH